MPKLIPNRGLIPAPFHALVYTIMLALSVALAGCSTSSKSQNSSNLMLSAQAGDVDAQYQLGRDYADSTFSNQPQAIYWLCQAAAQGHVSAQMRLASIFENDAGIPVAASNRLSNRGSAYFWYTAAASQGNDQALINRDALAHDMDNEEITDIKRRATRWQQAVCVEPG